MVKIEADNAEMMVRHLLNTQSKGGGGTYSKAALVSGIEQLCVFVCRVHIQDRQWISGSLLGETFWSRK